MSLTVSQEILDALTDVDMPRLHSQPGASTYLQIGQHSVPLYRCGSLVAGSGAAGLRAAVEMQRRDVNVMIISQSAWGGTSACSGSDKQTLHTANTKDQGDDFHDMAAAISAGGAMDEDIAYIEAVGSIRAMASLQYLGLALPQDQLGGTLRYQTDHDEVGRATSCGPRTSRLMVKVLAQEAVRLEIPFFNQTTAVKVLTHKRGTQSSVAGLLAVQARCRSAQNPFGLIVFQCSTLVLAAGGPGELYRDSVFPNGCFGALGSALEAGVALVNITENQFGIGTRREGFPWNLSGTYVQVIPHIYSVDEHGAEHHFLADYYRTTQEMASNIFRKGYQWPFHANRMLDFQSSLIDLAIVTENRRGRRVFMDFNRNPLAIPGDHEFSLERLDVDVYQYLKNAGADQQQPIDRLKHMNPLAIELYKRYKVDITVAPLEFAVNHQHMNGGIHVDSWGRSNVGGVYAVGEAAGTHGVTRPGGAALNAGQVFGTRVAEHVAASGQARQPSAIDITELAVAAIEQIGTALNTSSRFTAKDIQSQVQTRMSDHAGILCHPEDVAAACHEANLLNQSIRKYGITYRRDSEVARVLQWQQMALASEAVLAALNHFIAGNGGSRGARAICDPNGDALPMSSRGPLTNVRFRSERIEDKQQQLTVRLDGEQISVTAQNIRPLDKSARSFFERDWLAWLTGSIYSDNQSG
ncbi:MAG: FAD-binding protein [Pseudomonadota bacterium]